MKPLKGITLRDVANTISISEDDERLIADIIVMEKDAKGLSYGDLAKMLNGTNSVYKEMYGGDCPKTRLVK